MKSKKEELHTEESKEQQYLEGWKRALADLENIKKRAVIEKEQQRTYVKRDMIEGLIPLADNFRSLVEHAPTKDNDPWVMGATHVARQFDQVLVDFGVELINTIDIPFDPNIHEAVEEVEEKGKEGQVLEVVQAGYRVGDITIRPAKVKVTARQSSPTEIGDPDADDIDSRIRGNDNTKN